MRFAASSSAILLLPGLAAGTTIYEYLFESRSHPSYAGKSIKVAETERERIADLSTQVDGVVCFLPTDEAWDSMPGALEALLQEAEGNVRYDMLLAACAAVPVTSTSSVETLKNYARGNGGMVDSAYGSTYTMQGQKDVCEYVWDDRSSRYTTGRCASVIEGVSLSDGAIYYINKLLLPEDVEGSLEMLIGSMRRRRRM